MRLIDADKLIEQLREVDDEIVKGCIGVIQTQPTAYDVEAVAAELNETGRKLCENVGCSKECENCEHGALMRTIIEIVRGKE